jgi:hypothetical protein
MGTLSELNAIRFTPSIHSRKGSAAESFVFAYCLGEAHASAKLKDLKVTAKKEPQQDTWRQIQQWLTSFLPSHFDECFGLTTDVTQQLFPFSFWTAELANDIFDNMDQNIAAAQRTLRYEPFWGPAWRRGRVHQYRLPQPPLL